MKFTLPKIPEKPLALLGITRAQLGQLPAITLSALLSGMRTSLIRLTAIRLPGESVPRTLDARLSLFRQLDQTAGIKIHPVNPIAANIYQLSDTEISQLKQGRTTFIEKHITDQKGRTRPALISLDPITNSYVATRKDSLRAPLSISGLALSHTQQKDWVNGKPITLLGKQYRLDPHAESGIQGELVSKVSVSHSRIHDSDLLIDIGLLASGLGTIVLLEHLADLALHSRLLQKSDLLQDSRFREALASAATELPTATKTHDHKSLGQQLSNELAKAGYDTGVSASKDNSLSKKDSVLSAGAVQPTTAPRSRSPAL